MNGGKLEENNAWLSLYEIKWKVDSSGKFMIEPKEKMMKRASALLNSLGSTSPDIIDAGSLTFGNDDKPSLDIFDFGSKKEENTS